MNASRNILDCIGNTSLLPLRNIGPANSARILLKIESENPTGSMKDRMALAMIDGGVKARLTCVDPSKLDPSFAGREFDRELLASLPAHADPCGENGEFHTFVYDAPVFSRPIEIQPGIVLERDGFVFADVVPCGEPALPGAAGPPRVGVS